MLEVHQKNQALFMTVNQAKTNVDQNASMPIGETNKIALQGKISFDENYGVEK